MSSDEQFMKRVMEVVSKNLSNSEFDVEQMAKEIGISRTHLHRNKRAYRIPICQIRAEYQDATSYETPQGEKEQCLRIAYSVGFSSQTHFSTTFNNTTGFLPTEFIKQID